MNRRNELLQGLANIITDYRTGELPAPTLDHIERWIRQFDAEAQEPMLEELRHVFERTYYSREAVERFLSDLITSPELTGDNPAAFWRSAGLLNIQGGGASQREMLAEFDRILQARLGYGVEQCHPTSNVFIYLDDCVFSGARLKSDIGKWLENGAPDALVLHVITIVQYLGGEYNARKGKNGIEEVARKLNKKIGLEFWCCARFENRKFRLDDSDVLCPQSFPDEYMQEMTDAGYPPVERKGRSIGPAGIFSSPERRHLLEQQLFKAGLRVRELCPNLKEYHRPLGYTRLTTPGFGSMVVTFRNCPNSTPLALWVGAPWYPLFKRKTNAETEVMPWE